MLKNIRATNVVGQEYIFDNKTRLPKGLDLSGLSASVNYSESTGPGSKYQNTRLTNREFELELHLPRLKNDEIMMDMRREKIYQVFNPELNPIRFDFETSDGSPYYFKAELVAAPYFPTNRENNNMAFQKGLLQFTATDPFIYEAMLRRVEIATWQPNMEWPFEIFEGGIEVGYREPSLIRNVENPSSGQIGMTIQFKARSEVVNPELININTYEKIRLKITMQAGDLVEVTTHRGNRRIYLIRHNIKTSVFSIYDDDVSTFIQLRPGDNLFRYNCDSGLDYLDVTVLFAVARIGV